MKNEKKTKFPEPFYYLIFQINSEEKVQLKSLFTELKSFFENFPVLRWAGWDLHLGTAGRYVIDLEGIEHVDLLKRIRITEGGGIIIQGALTGNFLCWRGGETWEEGSVSKKIRSLALIEFTYSCFIALQRVLKDVPGYTSISSEIGFSGIDKQFSLNYNKVGSGFITLEKNFNDSGNVFSLQFSNDDLSDENLPITVYKVIEKIYRMFGLDETNIPYIKEISGKKMIDADQIKENK